LDRLKTLLFYSTILLPPVILAYLVLVLSVDVPYLDQWEFVSTLGKHVNGTLGLSDLWAFHNEHRLFFPRLLFLVLADLSGWNTIWEQATSFFLALVIFVSCLCIRRKLISSAGLPKSWKSDLTVSFIISVLVFSPSQWQNWFFGWQAQEFMQLLALLLGFLFLDSDKITFSRFMGAAACGIIATYSFAGGLLFWPIGATFLWRRSSEIGKRPSLFFLWLTGSASIIFLYLFHFHLVDRHPQPWGFVELISLYVKYLLCFIGSPIISYNASLASLTGLIGLTAFIIFSFLNFKDPAYRRACTLPLALAAFSVGSAAMTGFGRIAFGPEQALSSRYVTLANPFWIALLILIESKFRSTSQQGARGLIAAITMFCIAVLLFINAVYGTYKWDEQYNFLKPTRAGLVEGNNLELLLRLHPDPAIVIERRDILKRHNLSVFRK
jgi:hypothetical protein